MCHKFCWALFFLSSLSLVLSQDGSAPNMLQAAPGVAFEYKVHVDAGKEDCYYQYVQSEATLYVSQQVLKGGDGAIGFAIKNPHGKILYPYQWKANAEYEQNNSEEGYYSICLDNQFSKFSAKLVNLYLTTFKYDDWEKFTQELKELDVTVDNFTETLDVVNRKIQNMKQFQQLTRGLEARDHNILKSNLDYVTNLSIALCVVIVICGITQVYFVKSLFNEKKSSTNSFRKA